MLSRRSLLRNLNSIRSNSIIRVRTMSTNGDGNNWNPKLTPEQLSILKYKRTEPPNTGKYLNNKERGIYFCANCDAPLYKSETKFESGCGWPSFYEEINPQALKYINDNSMGIQRTEICCENCGGHLGHVFEKEGWSKSLGLPKDVRHCVNSLSLTFKSK